MRATIPEETTIPAVGRRTLVTPLLVLCAAQFILQLDFSIVNVALDTIQADLGFSDSGLQWVATSYALTFGSLLMLGGRLGDHTGRRRLLIGGLSVFAVASLACGLAGSPGLLIAARFLQGAAAAMIAPTVLSMLTAIYADGQDRVRALGVWAASVAAGGTAGVIAGGLLTELLGWRSIFLVNLPMIAVLIVFTRRVLPPVKADRARGLDPVGAGTLTLGIACLIVGFTGAERNGFGDPLTWGPLLASVLLGIAFFVNERRVAEPMVSLPFLAVPIRRISTVAMLLIGGVVTAYTFFIALSLQQILGFSPAETGFGLMPSGIVMLGTSLLASHPLIGRFGLKPILLVGMITVAMALLIFAQIDSGTEYVSGVLPGLVLNSFGIGLVFPCVSIGITKNVAPRDQGIAGGLVPAAQQIGSAVVLALLATLAAAVSRSDGGSLVSGYRVGWLAALGIVVLTGMLVAMTSFRGVEDPSPAA